tara:strand:+ start:37 stop:273 length:237 start_codon:yes stop_codon:yes gene_type:complete
MGKFYTANEQLQNYLIESGLTFHDREDSLVSYFTDHRTGNQVKLNNSNKLVSLLNSFGQLIDISSCFTDNQINKFLAN